MVHSPLKVDSKFVDVIEQIYLVTARTMSYIYIYIYIYILFAEDVLATYTQQVLDRYAKGKVSPRSIQALHGKKRESGAGGGIEGLPQSQSCSCLENTCRRVHLHIFRAGWARGSWLRGGGGDPARGGGGGWWPGDWNIYLAGVRSRESGNKLERKPNRGWFFSGSDSIFSFPSEQHQVFSRKGCARGWTAGKAMVNKQCGCFCWPIHSIGRENNMINRGWSS